MMAATQSSVEAVRQRGLRPWPKGQSGNPSGRRKSLESLIAKQTKNGADLVAFYADIFYRRGEFEHGRIPLASRMEAATWLADRLWGKPKQMTEVTGKDGGPLQVETTDATREALLAEIQERRARLTMLPPPAEEEGA